jgi:hypothetical protein
MSLKIISPRTAAGVIDVWLAFFISPAKAASPSIVITNMPAFGSHGKLSGLVLNANLATNCVAVFIYVAGSWYSKPSCASQLTPIQPDGTWTANITPNVNDVNATEIAAFLVPTNYNQPCVNGAKRVRDAAQTNLQ